MGYEFTYKLKPENREAVKKMANGLGITNACEECIDDLCTDFAFAMMKPEHGDISSVRFYIKLLMTNIYQCILGMYLIDAAKRDDDESFFCGWHLANLTADSIPIEPSDIWKGNSIVTDLLKMAILVPIPDYFDSPDNFNSKFEEINALVNEFRNYAEEKAIEYVVIKLKQMGAEEVRDENEDVNL